jgi:hypothetical protein
MGDTRYVTLVSPDEPSGTELLLEPNGEHPATKAYKKAIYDEGIPLTAFLVDDIESEHARLKGLLTGTLIAKVYRRSVIHCHA